MRGLTLFVISQTHTHIYIYTEHYFSSSLIFCRQCESREKNVWICFVIRIFLFNVVLRFASVRIVCLFFFSFYFIFFFCLFVVSDQTSLLCQNKEKSLTTRTNTNIRVTVCSLSRIYPMQMHFDG